MDSARKIGHFEAAIRARNQNKSNFESELIPKLDAYVNSRGSWPYLYAIMELTGQGETLGQGPPYVGDRQPRGGRADNHQFDRRAGPRGRSQSNAGRQ